jgi:hypothetical protein
MASRVGSPLLYPVEGGDDGNNDSYSNNMQVDSIMFTSLCAAFSNWAPIVPPVVRRHSSRWRFLLSVVIVIMTFSASFAHLRHMIHKGTDRRVEENAIKIRSLRLFRSTDQLDHHNQLPTAPTTTTDKDATLLSPRVLVGATMISWMAWGIMVATHPAYFKRRIVLLDGSGRAILTCVVFVIACILTNWTRIRYFNGDANDVK